MSIQARSYMESTDVITYRRRENKQSGSLALNSPGTKKAVRTKDQRSRVTETVTGCDSKRWINNQKSKWQREVRAKRQAAAQMEPQGTANATHDIQRYSVVHVYTRRCTFEQTVQHACPRMCTHTVQKERWDTLTHTGRCLRLSHTEAPLKSTVCYDDTECCRMPWGGCCVLSTVTLKQ